MKIDHDFTANELGLLFTMLDVACPKTVEELNKWNEEHGITWRFTHEMVKKLENIFGDAADKAEVERC